MQRTNGNAKQLPVHGMDISPAGVHVVIMAVAAEAEPSVLKFLIRQPATPANTESSVELIVKLLE